MLSYFKAGLEDNEFCVWVVSEAFSEYEQLVNDSVAGRLAILLCTYSLNSCGANELLDVVATHQFATARRCQSCGSKDAGALSRLVTQSLRVGHCCGGLLEIAEFGIYMPGLRPQHDLFHTLSHFGQIIAFAATQNILCI